MKNQELLRVPEDDEVGDLPHRKDGSEMSRSPGSRQSESDGTSFC